MDNPALYKKAVKGRHSSTGLPTIGLLFLVQGVNANAAAASLPPFCAVRCRCMLFITCYTNP